MKVQTIYVSYEPGEYYRTQGHKGYEGKRKNKYGRYVTPTGYGWATECKPSRIMVGLEVEGKCHEVNVAGYFKEEWGRLTAGRVEAIKSTVPDELVVIKQESTSGKSYYVVDESLMEEWLCEAKALKSKK